MKFGKDAVRITVGIVALAVVATAVYFLRDYKFVKRATEAPYSNTSAKVSNPPEPNGSPQGQTVRASTISVVWLEQPVVATLYDILTTEKYQKLRKQYDDTVLNEARAYKLGTVRGAPYDGYGIYIFHTGMCDGIGCGRSMYRVIKEPGTSKLFVLNKYSDQFETNEEGWLFDIKLPNADIPELNLPAEFSWRGLTFKKQSTGFGGTEYWFTDQELVAIARHPSLGIVYTTSVKDRTEGVSSHAFYVRTPDNRVVSYAFVPPFVTDERIPQIRWSDGTMNTSDYAWGDMGGCGALNIFAVRSEAEVKPEQRLSAAGNTATGDTVYSFKNINDPELKETYETAVQFVPTGEEKMTLTQYIAKRPIFYWKDQFGRWIRFTRADILPQAECGKPVIYLYPPKEMDARVVVGLKGPMTKSEPAHGSTGWSVVARPDGFVVNKSDGKTYPNLYWEGFGVNYQTPKQGFVVEAARVDEWLTATLRQIGFTDRENREFREFWVPRLPSSGWIFITFVSQSDFDRDAPLRITPKPDAVYRIFMEWKPLAAPTAVEPLTLPKIIRRGFTVVEWGGALH